MPFFKATPLFRRPCNVDQSAMAAGRPEKLHGFEGWERVL